MPTALGYKEAKELIERRHPEYAEFRLVWRKTLDALEGGQRYRDAIYGLDARGFPIRNLIRHQREYPPPTQLTYSYGMDPLLDQYARAAEDSYENRRARTPVPPFLQQVIDEHLSKIYANEIDRRGDPLMDWWKDVDGRGTKIDHWMSEEVGPILLAAGMVDLCFHHPAPTGPIQSKLDSDRQGLGRCVVEIILPENIPWWLLTPDKSGYAEILVKEIIYTDKGTIGIQWRHWDATSWVLYDDKGGLIGQDTHPFGVVPIIRCFDRRRVRCENVAASRYEAIVELQREFYNKDSETIRSDTLHSHPTLQGPVQAFKGGAQLPIGPDYALPIYNDDNGHPVPWQFLSPPSSPQDSLRKNKTDTTELIDRVAKLTKPAGAARGGGSKSGSGVVGQSGVSKMMDQLTGNAFLIKLTESLANCERKAARMAFIVLNHREPNPAELEEIRITYPAGFNMYVPQEIVMLATGFQTFASAIGSLPLVEAEFAKRIYRLIIVGKTDDEYLAMDNEIDQFADQKQQQKDQGREMALAALRSGMIGGGPQQGQQGQPVQQGQPGQPSEPGQQTVPGQPAPGPRPGFPGMKLPGV